MCGITGFVNFKKDIQNEFDILKNMCQTLHRRGPDEEGFYVSRQALLAHRRLSIIDIENGKQPMSYAYNGKTYTIVYNGQLYNTKELKDELRKEADFRLKVIQILKFCLNPIYCMVKMYANI